MEALALLERNRRISSSPTSNAGYGRDDVDSGSKRKYPGTQFVILSGYAEFEYAQKALQLGAKSYILKPIDEEELVKTLIEAREEILQRRKEIFIISIFRFPWSK